MTDGSITCWISRLRAGDVAAAQGLWELYFRPMVELARRRLGAVPRRAADEEDAALSAFNSFCAGARGGRFPRLADRHNLWPLLAAITDHKCADLVRREARLKRGGRLTAVPVSDFDQIAGRELPPEIAVQAAEELERRLVQLDRAGDPDLRPVALARLAGEPVTAIAARLGCVRRTVERKLNLIVRLWSEGGSP